MSRRAHRTGAAPDAQGPGRARRVAGGTATAWRRLPGEGATTVQLLPVFLADGELRVAVGDVLDVAPAVYTTAHAPGSGAGAGAGDGRGDELGRLDTEGEVLTAPLAHDDGCGCRVDVLDCGGVLLPLNWAATNPVDSDDGATVRVRVRGALYLDPALAVGTDHGEAVALCRRRYRVRALRCYRRTGPGGSGRPVDPRALGRTPEPDAVRETLVYVADLVVEPPYE